MNPVSLPRSTLAISLFWLLTVLAPLRAAEPAPSVEERLARLEQAVAVPAVGGVNTGDNAWLLVSSAMVLNDDRPGIDSFLRRPRA
ncbi:MAG: hypothetical protein ACYDC1_21330 [Limisphaerales bacterium]